MNKVDEKQLTQQLMNPSTRRQAFEQMVGAYGEKIYWQVRRIVLSHDDADDVVQNVMMKAWTHLDTFQGQAKLSTWLYRIAINESLDFMRRQKTHAAVSADVADNGVAATLMADDYFDGDATAAKLQEAIATLPDAQRTVFTLRYFDEMKYSDISDMLGTSEGALKASYHIAAKKIYEFFMHND